jgi:hypothetical protein
MKDQVWSENSLIYMTCFHIAYSLCHILGALYYVLHVREQCITIKVIFHVT